MVKIPYKLLEPFDTQVLDLPRPWATSDWPLCIDTRYPRGPPLPKGRVLVQFFNDNFLNDGSSLNKCIQNVMGGKAPHPWADNVIVVRKETSDAPVFLDAVLEEDLPVLFEYWKEYGKEGPKGLQIGFF